MPKRPRIIYRTHAVQRMWQRNITPEEVVCTLENGETIEEYPDDSPYPSKLLLGWTKGRPLHLVVADNQCDNTLVVITVYQPDLQNWQTGFRKRRI